MFDTERFITSIRKHDCLWNPNASTYYNRDMKWDAWVEVYRVVLEEEDEYFEELSSLDQKRKIEDLQKRWKNVRDQFKKFQNKIQLLDAEAIAKLAKPYIYAESLDFLIPVLETKTIKKPRTSNSRSVRKRRQTVDQQTIAAAAAASGTPAYGLRKKIVKTENDINKTESKENNHDKTIPVEMDVSLPLKIEEEGPEKLFLLSLLPQIKELNSDQKNYLYIEFLQAIQKAKHFISPRYNFNYVMNQYSQQVHAAQAKAASQVLVKSERISSSSSSSSSSSDDEADDTPAESTPQQQPAIL